jgi:glutamyl-tRNA synthetase
MQYREEGFLPEALLNYLVRLGWSHGDQEVFSIDQMIELFDVKDVNKAASSFNPEKLLWLNQQYIKDSAPTHVARHLSHHLGLIGIDPAQEPPLHEVVKAQQERAKTLVEMAANSVFFYQDFEHFDEKAAQKNLTAAAGPALEQLQERFATLADWQPEPIHQAVLATAEALGEKLGKVAQPLRVAMSGGTVSPPIDVTVYLVGRERTLARLGKALAFINSLAAK